MIDNGILDLLEYIIEGNELHPHQLESGIITVALTTRGNQWFTFTNSKTLFVQDQRKTIPSISKSAR